MKHVDAEEEPSRNEKQKYKRTSTNMEDKERHNLISHDYLMGEIQTTTMESILCNHNSKTTSGTYLM